LPNSGVTLFVAMPMSEIRGLWLKTVSGTYLALVFLLLGGFAAYRYALRRQYAEHLVQQRLEATRRESDQRFHSILDSIASQVAVLDHHGVIVAVNDTWRRFALETCVQPGKSPENTQVGSNYLDICQESQGASTEGPWKHETAFWRYWKAACRFLAWNTHVILLPSSAGSPCPRPRW
jgi:hypothetical protein